MRSTTTSPTMLSEPAAAAVPSWRGATIPPVSSSAPPPERLRRSLAARRERREPFPRAWSRALPDAIAAVDGEEQADWELTFESTRGRWRAAYELEPPSPAERAVATVATDPDRTVPIVDRNGTCPRCGGSIPPDRGPVAVYCSRRCQRAANGRQVAA